MAGKRDRVESAPGWREAPRRRHGSRVQHSTDSLGDDCFRVPLAEELLRREERTLPSQARDRILTYDLWAYSQPQEVAYFSKFAEGRVRFDRSNLLRYKEPPVGIDLLQGLSAYVSKDEADPTGHPAPLAPFLDAIWHFQVGAAADKRPHFVTFRNNMNKIMGTPYNTSSDWTFCMEKRDGCVYLDVRRTQQEIESNRQPHENQRRGAYAGRRFEIYATHARESGDDVSSGGDDGRQVNEEQEFCSISSVTLGEKRLIVAAEIDCCDEAVGDGAPGYVELKTFRLLEREKDRFVFERFKLLAFWIQSYLVGTPKIVCGFRDEDFTVRKLQTFKTADLPSFGRKYWSPTVCLNFTKMLLDWLYERAEEGQVYRVSYAPRRQVIEMALATGEESFLPAQ